MKFNIDFKRFLILVVSLVVLFIPTYIAIASYYANETQPLPVGTVTELTISDPNGRTTTVSSDNDTEGLITLFKSINDSGSAVASLPDNRAGGAFLLASFRSGDISSSYKYYFSTNSSDCYYTDPDGKVFKISTAAAKSFLGTGHAVYLYKTSAPPTLTVSGTDIVSPASLNWFYLAASGTYQNYSENTTTDLVLSYDVGNDVVLGFDVKPSVCNLKIYNGATMLFDGAYDSLPPLNLERNSTLTFILDADWYRTEDCEFYGEATYTFKANLSAPADFALGKSEVEVGEMLVLSGVNVTDVSKITVTCKPSIAFDPTFYADGDFVHALIPINWDLTEGEYEITVTYGVTTKSLYLTVKPSQYGFDKKNYSISATLIATNYTESDISDYNKLFTQITSSSEPIKYFSGKFLDYGVAGVLHNNGAKITLGFGKLVSLTNAAGRSFRNNGVDFSIVKGAEVPVMNSGKVAYVGSCDVLGRFVVVDHGMGLKSWYTHLSETSVSLGDIVSSGQSVGKTGDTGFIIANRTHIELTVVGVPVSPYPLWVEGIPIHSFN